MTGYKLKDGYCKIESVLSYAATNNVGASTAPQYTPDAFWWNLIHNYYALVGGHSSDNLRCGNSFLFLFDNTSVRSWQIGAYICLSSNKYTPDGFWWDNGQRDYALVGGNTNNGVRCGGSSLNLYYAAGSRNWPVGASLQL